MGGGFEGLSAPSIARGTVPTMRANREVPVELDLLEIATELDFTEIHQIERGGVLSPLLSARWKSAPVGLTHLTGSGGFLGIAFYQGRAVPTPEEIIEGGRFIEARWDDILDTSWGDPAVLLVIAKAVLDFRADGRGILYRGNEMPDIPGKL
jgi:hypothetical protein